MSDKRTKPVRTARPFPPQPQQLTTQQAIDLALRHHTAGRLPEAGRIYQQILRTEPNQPVALHLLGVVAHQAGKANIAVDLITKALAIKPDYANAHNNLGNALQDLGKLDEAVAAYRKTIAIKSDHAEAHNNLGNVLKDLGELDEAVASYHEALAIKPDYAEAHYNLGAAFKKQEKLDEAVASYAKALAINPDYADAHCNLGYVLQDMGKLDEAFACYRKALAIKPDAEAHNNLGYVLQDMGKLDEAVASYRKALAIKPDYAEGHRHLSHVKKFIQYDTDIKAMEEIYAMPSLNDEQRMHLAFGLGKSFEDLRQYEKAFSFYLTGNAIKRGTYEFSIETVEKNFERLKKSFTTDLFGKHQAAGSSDETPIFILGMPRSGTTLVEQILASHPNVHGAGELKFMSRIITSSFSKIDDAGFAEMINQASIGDLSRAGGEYIAMIRRRAESLEFITDKMPLNFRFVGMIRLMLPNAKIIHCRRDSRDTCLSIFKNYFSADGNYYAYDLGELGRYYNAYRDLMRHWHSVLPGFIYDLHYEDMVADQETQSRALLAYCGLEWDDACLEFHKTDRPVQTASAVQVRRPIYKDSVQSWKRYEKQLAPLLDVLANQQSAA